MTVERLLPPTTDVLDLVLGSLLRLAAHHESSRKIDSTFALPLFQGSHQFGAIGEPAVARIKTVYKERDRTERRALVCTEKSNPRVVMVKSAQDGVRTDETGSLNRPRIRRIFV